MGRTTAVVIVGGIFVLGWVLVPVVDMIRHGTIDQRTVRRWRRESPRDGAAGEDDDVAVPRPRAVLAVSVAREIPPGRVRARGDR